MTLFNSLFYESYRRERRARRRWKHLPAKRKKQQEQTGGSMETPTSESPLAAMFRKCKVPFGGVFPADQIPNPVTTYCIINTDPSHLPGKHWTLLWRDPRRENGPLKFFDSYGRSFSSYFSTEMVDSSVSSVNSQSVQSNDSNTCGEWSTLYAILSHRDENLLTFINAERKSNPNDRSNDVKLMQLWQKLKEERTT